MAQIQYKFNKNDEYCTPTYAVEPLVKYLKPRSKIWCPFDKADSQYVQVFQRHGFEVHYGHIDTGQDFFKTTPPLCDYIISNPPYSQKGDVFQKLFDIGKPFAMLINFQGIFDQKQRFELFKNHRIEMLYLYPRINYIKFDEYIDSSVPFQSGYLCSGIFDKQINFEYVLKTKEG